MNINKINELAELSGFEFFGLRVMTGGKSVNVGELVDSSFVWVDGECTGEDLSGTCALDLEFDGWEIPESRFNKMLEAAKIYSLLSDCEQVVVIGGYDCEHGEDMHEIIIRDAVCVAVI